MGDKVFYRVTVQTRHRARSKNYRKSIAPGLQYFKLLKLLPKFLGWSDNSKNPLVQTYKQ